MILCCFPGVGKTWATNHFKVLDSDSSHFPKGPDRFTQYGEYIQQAHEDGRHMLASSHLETRTELKRRGLPYLVVVPYGYQKEDWIAQRIAGRTTGINDLGFINLLASNWENWLSEIMQNEMAVRLVDAYDLTALERILDQEGVPRK